MNYKLAIFDMDGTILHTLDDIQDSINHIFRNHNLPERTYEEVRSFVGSGLRKLVERAVPEGTSAEDTEVLVSEFCAYYADHCAIKTAPYEGVIDAINKLRAAGVKTAVSTNKPQASMEELVELHFKGLFDVALGESPERARKPAPDSVYATLDILGLEKADAVYIGDSDVGERVNFGCGTVTTNYDGYKKYRTTIEDDAFIGCNTNLVAPVRVGRGAYTAAGSTVTEDVPEGALAVAREKQRNIEGWVKKFAARYAKKK